MRLCNPFKKPDPIVFRTKTIDWSKVKTLEEVIYILSNMERFKRIEVDESEWDDPVIKGLIGKVITETTYCGFDTTTKVYEDEPKSDA